MDERAKLSRGVSDRPCWSMSIKPPPACGPINRKYLDLMVPYTLGIPTKDAASNRPRP
jgi:hypothetical protein